MGFQNSMAGEALRVLPRLQPGLGQGVEAKQTPGALLSHTPHLPLGFLGVEEERQEEASDKASRDRKAEGEP